ncbi:MAG: AAA family ATPase [Spirochaetales bacterium]|nr:AAA family ATPase [Spirochaetales bacterium]
MYSKLNRIYVAATRQNDGKTFCTLGLLHLFHNQASKIGYIKPVGQQVMLINNQAIDKDAALMMGEFKLEQQFAHMSPVAVPKGFTRDFLDKGQNKNYDLAGNIVKAFEETSRDKDVMIIEGTGHAGVGSVFGLSNAAVAGLLKAKVIIVTCAGIGKPIDEVALNTAVFRDHSIDVIGVIVNKVDKEKYDDISHYARLGFKNQGIDVLGVIPYESFLELPKMRHIKKALDLDLLNFSENPDDSLTIETICIPIEDEPGSFKDKNCLILLSSRDEAWIHHHLKELSEMSGQAILLCTKSQSLNYKTLELLAEKMIPVYSTKKGLYDIASILSNLSVKLGREDRKKIDKVKAMISRYVDFDLLSRKINS